MEFRIKKEKRLLSVTAIIPSGIRRQFLKGKLTALEIALLKDKKNKMAYTDKWRNQCMRPYLCVLYAHSNHTAPQILSTFSDKRFNLQNLQNAAIIAGRFDVIQLLHAQQGRDLNRAIEFENFTLIRSAAATGTLAIVRQLMDAYKGDISKLLQQTHILDCACSRGYLALLDYLLSLAPECNEDLISDNDFSCLQLAASFGKLSILRRIVSRFPHLVPTFLSSNNYRVVASAAQNKRLTTMKYLLSLEPEKKYKILTDGNYNVFNSASCFKNLAAIQYIWSEVPSSEIRKMIIANDYTAVRKVASMGWLELLQLYVKKIPDCIDDLIKAHSFEVVKCTARSGALPVLQYLISLRPQWAGEMIRADRYAAFTEAAQWGHVDVLRFFIALLPEDTASMLNANIYAAFRGATEFGNLEVIDYLIGLYPPRARQMLALMDFEAFSTAAKHGYLDILKSFVALAPDWLPDMIFAGNWRAFYEAVATIEDDLSVVKYLVHLAGDKAEEMVTANEYCAFGNISTLNVLKYLMELFPSHQKDILLSQGGIIAARAAALNKFDLLDYLVKLAPNRIQDLLFCDYYLKPLSAAAISKPDTEMLRYLIQLCEPDKREALLCADNFNVFLCATNTSGSNTPNALLYLFDLVPHLAEAIVCSENFQIVRRAVDNANLVALKLFYDRAPHSVQTLLDEDPSIFEQAIKRNCLKVLDFLLENCSDLTQKNIFLNHEKTNTSNCNADNAFASFIPKTLFKDPSNWGAETTLNIIFSCIQQKYFSIAKLLIYSLWIKDTDYDALLITEILMQAPDYPDQAADLITFLIDRLGFDCQDLKNLLISDYQVGLE